MEKFSQGQISLLNDIFVLINYCSWLKQKNWSYTSFRHIYYFICLLFYYFYFYVFLFLVFFVLCGLI